MLRKAVKVLPEPVGLETSTFSLLCISGTAIDCGGVRSSNFELNHFSISGSNPFRTSSLPFLFVMYFTMFFDKPFATD